MGIKREDLNFEKLLKPYKEGGTEQSPVERTIGTIASKLIVANRLSPEIVGAAILKVFTKMAHEGLEFKGNGKYGSKGKELYSCIKAQAVHMVQERHHEDVLAVVSKSVACVHRKCPKRSKKLVKQTRWHRFVSFMLRPRGVWRV